MQVNKWIASVLVGTVAATFAFDAEAQRRFGGGRNLGKQQPQLQQRQAQPQPQQQTSPTQQAAPSQQPNAASPAAGAGAAAAARTASPMRNMLIGAAAGLGLMALASYLGLGEQFATLMLFLLIGLLLVTAFAFFMRRSQAARAGYPNARGAGVLDGLPSAPKPMPTPQPVQRTSLDINSAVRPGSAMDEFMRGGAARSAQPWGVPADFDSANFLVNAKQHFRQLQAAWDGGSLEQLQEFTTNEMFIALTHELRARGQVSTRTEVMSLDAQLLGIESTAQEHVASVRFTGQLKVDSAVEAVDEVWNLTKPSDGRSGWLLAGIQQLAE